MHPYAKALLMFATFLLLLIPYYDLFSTSDVDVEGDIDPLVMPVGAFLGALLLLAAVKLFGQRFLKLLELLLLLTFLPLFFWPFTRALHLEGWELGLSLMAVALYHLYPRLKDALALAMIAAAASLLAVALPLRDALLMALLLALYDYAAVKVGFMGRVAEKATHSLLSIGAPPTPSNRSSSALSALGSTEGPVGPGVVVMGAGDYLIAGLLLLSAWDEGPLKALAVLAGLLSAFPLLLREMEREGLAPALPYLTAGAVVGLATLQALTSLPFP